MEYNRKSVDQVRTYAEELGYRIVFETDLLDISGQVKLLLEGYGEEFEVYFKLRPKTGYLAWDHAGIVHDYSSSWVPSWVKLKAELEAVREDGISEGHKPYDKTEEGCNP